MADVLSPILRMSVPALSGLLTIRHIRGWTTSFQGLSLLFKEEDLGNEIGDWNLECGY